MNIKFIFSIFLFCMVFMATGCSHGIDNFYITYNIEGMEKMSSEDSLQCEISVIRDSYVVMYVEGPRTLDNDPKRWYSCVVYDNRGEIVARELVTWAFHSKKFFIRHGKYKFMFQFSEDLLKYIRTEKKKLLVAPFGFDVIQDFRLDLVISLWEFDLLGEIISPQTTVSTAAPSLSPQK